MPTAWIKTKHTRNRLKNHRACQVVEHKRSRRKSKMDNRNNTGPRYHNLFTIHKINRIPLHHKGEIHRFRYKRWWKNFHWQIFTVDNAFFDTSNFKEFSCSEAKVRTQIFSILVLVPLGCCNMKPTLVAGEQKQQQFISTFYLSSTLPYIPFPPPPQVQGRYTQIRCERTNIRVAKQHNLLWVPHDL